MIPDDTFVFNGHGVRRLFDDYEVRLRHLLGQDALPATGGGRHLLYTCPACKHPWYKAGHREYPRLTPEQLTFLRAILHANVRRLHCLPGALCPICSTVKLGGMFSIGEYPQHSGYHLLWESASPSRSRLQAMICCAEGVTLDTLLHLSPDVLLEPGSKFHSILAWLEICPLPEAVQVYSEPQREFLARRFPPGSASDGKAQSWQGCAWEAVCPPLGARVLISLAITSSSPDPSLYFRLLLSWHALARALRMVL